MTWTASATESKRVAGSEGFDLHDIDLLFQFDRASRR